MEDTSYVGPSASQIPDVAPEDCIKILVATDNHIGYNERDPIRGQDSINTFKEILELAVENDVDMLLLVGDLFHENKPSRASLYQTIALMREYTMGRKPISLQLISDAGIGLKHGFNFPQINYEDENLNIGIPIFSIHGNHDDPQGAGPEGALCALDILSASGLINYFGRQDLPGAAANDEEAREQGLQVKPILLQKGRTKLAMYGIGNIRDERFHAEMRHNRISMYRPDDEGEEWFNLLLIHQNRAARGVKNFVPENGFGDEVHLVLWGHEHDCRITPESVGGRQYMISQPGSSVATSLSKGEAIPKHVAILKIQDTNYQMDPIPLRTVRPFVFEDVVLADERDAGNKLENKASVNKFLKGKVEALIQRAQQQWEAQGRDPDEPTMLPLIRLRVDYTSTPDSPFEVGNPQRFGQDFTGRVANPRDIVQFHKKKNVERKKKTVIDQPEGAMDVDAEGDEEDELTERIKGIQVETLVREYLDAQHLQVIAENEIGSAVMAFVEKQEKDAIKEIIKHSLRERQEEVIGKAEAVEIDSDEDIEQEIEAAKQAAFDQYEKNPEKSRKAAKAGRKSKEDDSDFDKMSDDTPKKGKKKAAPKKAATSTSKAKGKAKALFHSDDEEEEEEEGEEEEEEERPKKKAPTKKAPAKKAPTKKQAALDFAPSRTSGRAAASKASKKITAVEISDSESEAEDFGQAESSGDEQPRAKKARR